LAETVEYIEIPRDVLVVCVGKSTIARCGLIVNVTPLEPEWRGRVTLEISNTTPLPAKLYANEGIAQLLFFRAAAPCKTSYADKKGKYQDQPGLTLPLVTGEKG
jgi:dCTP deaminase